MKTTIETVGIVGFGAMGQFMAEKMFVGCEVVAHDPLIETKKVGEVALVGINEISACDAVVIATPARQIPKVLDLISKSTGFRDDSLVADVCSVKLHPTEWFDKIIPQHPQRLLCHPLVGPQTGKKTLAGHRLLLTEATGTLALNFVERLRMLGMNTMDMTADEHDRQMAQVQAVPFIVGRMVALLGLSDDVKLQTSSRLALRKLTDLDAEQSDDLFDTIVNFNPYARRIKTKLAEIAQQLLADPRHDMGSFSPEGSYQQI